MTRRGKMAYIPIVLVTLLMFGAACWGYLLPAYLPSTDPARYQCYALVFWFGTGAIHSLPQTQCAFLHIVTQQPAFHRLPVEYPPLTLLIFSLPLLIPPLYYQLAFAFLMALVMITTCWQLQRYGPRGSALVCVLYMLIGVPALALARFDLLPALLTLLCIIAAERRRWTSAYCALAIGVLLKIYPILLLPALFLAEQQALGRLRVPPADLAWRDASRQFRYIMQEMRKRRWWNGLLCLLQYPQMDRESEEDLEALPPSEDVDNSNRTMLSISSVFALGIIVIITGIFALLDFQGAVVSQLSFFVQRPVQVESIESTVLWIAQHLGVPWQRIEYTYGSINIIGDKLGPGISLLATSCLLVGVIYILWLQWCKKLDIVQASIALILVFLVTGKVFSSQYLIWLIPLLAYAGAFNRFWIFCWGMISLLTNILLLFFYTRLPSPLNAHIIKLPVGFMAVVGARNLLFVFVMLAYLFNWRQARLRRWFASEPKQLGRCRD